MTSENVHNFLRRHGMHPEAIDMAACCAVFQKEMQKGLMGETSTLMMIPSYVSPEREVPRDMPTIVLDAGGTNLRMGLCRFCEGGAELSQVRTLPMPGTKESMDADRFVAALADLTEPFLAASHRLGFCFSFPAEITPRLDGIVLGFNKEVAVSGAQGLHLCQALSDVLVSRGHQPLQYALINDTVAALMGGYGATDPAAYDGYIGFILGTGTNCCYTEYMENIPKLPPLAAHTMVVNMEAGGYGLFPTGTFDHQIDARSGNPGEHLYEKMVSGGYFGDIALETLKGAAAEGLLTGIAPRKLGMKDVCAYLEQPDGNSPIAKFCGNVEEADTVYTILDLLLERAAKMVAVNLTAILLQSDMGKRPTRPACIVVEGSTFQKAVVYQRKIYFYMRVLAEDTYGRYFRFRSFSDNNLKGAAVAALLKQDAGSAALNQ